VLLALACAAPAVRLAARGGATGIHLAHAETLAASTNGRWLVRPPHRFMSDAFAGEMPTFYNVLSDTLLNLGAAASGLMPMTFQALVYGPALAFLFVWLGYLSLAAATEDRATAALAAMGAGFAVDPGLTRLVQGPEQAAALGQLLHVPFHALGLGNGQALGWVLFFPAVTTFFVARQRFTRGRAALHGAVLGLLFLAHTLTFVNVAAAEVAGLVVQRAAEGRRDRRDRFCAFGLAGLLLAFLGMAWLRPPHTFATLGALLGGALVLLFATDRDRRFYLWSYLPAALVVLPYAQHLARNWAGLAGRDGDARFVPPEGLLLFFALHWGAAAAAARWARRGPLLAWALSMLAATLLLASNQAWGWGNHPYRFAINLVFPLSVLAALALRRAPRLVSLPLAIAFLAAAAPEVWRLADGRGAYVRVAARQRLGAFLDELRAATDAEPDRQALLLNPPEFRYPEGAVQSAVLMNASSLRGFVPDYRYLLDAERHRRRLFFFCLLFPSYPHAEAHTGRHACDGGPEPPDFRIKDRRIVAAALPLHGIRYAASVGPPFNFVLPGRAQENAWPLVAGTPERHFLFRTESAPLPGVALWSKGGYDESSFSADFSVAEAGPHHIVAGGPDLAARLGSVRVDGRELRPLTHAGSWLRARQAIAAGRHRLFLGLSGRAGEDPRDLVAFAAVVDERWAEHYFGDRPR
jgi:hypothetical protein